MSALIGITMSYVEGTHRLRHDYVHAVERAGGIPIAVCASRSLDRVGELVERLDGLIVTGGPAITRGLIGELPADISSTHPLREAFDARITSGFMGSTKPLLGICYGMQLMNALDGGAIYADVEAQVEGAGPHSPKRGGTTHEIEIDAGSHLERVLGARRASVNTRHIQAVARAGTSFVVSARAEAGVIESIESPDARMLGVQFHPERMGLDAIFEDFVSRART